MNHIDRQLDSPDQERTNRGAFTTILCAIVILIGSVAYSSIVGESLAYFSMLASAQNPYRAAFVAILCATCAVATLVLWNKGRIPLGFFLNVLGGFFLGAASASASPLAEINASVGFTAFAAGYLIVRRNAKKVTVETIPDEEVRRQSLERLLEATMAPQSTRKEAVPKLAVAERN